MNAARLLSLLGSARALALLLIGLPMLAATLYHLGLAHDRYVSTAVLTVRRASHDAASVNGLTMLLPGVASASQEDTRFLRSYLHSQGLMQRLDARLHLRRHYEAAASDLFFRLWPGTSQEWMLEYWRARVEITLDEMSGLLTVRTQGFDPAFAQQVNQALLEEAERFVNDISQRIAEEQLRFARGELERAAEQLGRAQRELLDFQQRHRMLDAQADALATGQRAAELRAQQTRLEAELAAKQAFLQEDAPDLVTLRAQLAAVRQQIERETRGATAPSPAAPASGAAGGSLNRLALQFHEIKARTLLAEGAYRSALASVETTRIEASRKVKSLVVIEPPTRPDEAEYPRRLYDLVTLLVACGVLFTLARLAIVTIQEHRD